jgi:antirestriction protein
LTLTASYKEVLKAETVEFIESLIEDNYELTDILEFIDENSEAALIEYYVEYCEQGEKCGYKVVDAFVGENGICNVEHCEDAYRGQWDSPESFVEEYLDEIAECDIPAWVAVDYSETWRCSLRYDYDFVDGYVFTRDF